MKTPDAMHISLYSIFELYLLHACKRTGMRPSAHCELRVGQASRPDFYFRGNREEPTPHPCCHASSFALLYSTSPARVH
jgi:hypothetical protein